MRRRRASASGTGRYSMRTTRGSGPPGWPRLVRRSRFVPRISSDPACPFHSQRVLGCGPGRNPLKGTSSVIPKPVALPVPAAHGAGDCDRVWWGGGRGGMPYKGGHAWPRLWVVAHVGVERPRVGERVSMALAGPRPWGRASEGASIAARAPPRACSPTRPASCASCTICPNSGGGEVDKGSREKKGGSEAAPGKRRMYWEHWRFRLGQRGAAPGQASPSTGSPRNSVWTDCHPVRGSAGDGVRVQTGSRQPPGQHRGGDVDRPGERRRGGARQVDRGQPSSGAGRPARRPSDTRKNSTIDDLPAVGPRTGAPTAAGTEPSPSGRRSGVDASPS